MNKDNTQEIIFLDKDSVINKNATEGNKPIKDRPNWSYQPDLIAKDLYQASNFILEKRL